MSKEIRIESGRLAMIATLNGKRRTGCISITLTDEPETIHVSPEELRDIKDMAAGFLAMVNER